MADQQVGMAAHPRTAPDWEQRYATGDAPWDSGRPSEELRRVLGEGWFGPGRVLELGCGTGTNAVFLAQQGFEVTAVDLSERAVQQARAQAQAAGVRVNFLVGDALNLSDTGGPFPLVFDRGLYHVVRQANLAGFLRTLARVTAPRGHYLTLAGNPNEPGPPAGRGPPTVHAREMLAELGELFDLVQLREFRFDGVQRGSRAVGPLAWSALWRRR